MTDKKTKKEKVLHTRIPVELEQEIKDRAEKLRVPVSNLVRNILEDAFALVQHVGSNVEQVVGQVTRDAERLSATAASHATRVAEGLSAATRVPGSVPPKETKPSQQEQDGPAIKSPVPAVPPAEAKPSGPSEATAEARARVFAWQPVTLNILDRCADCGRTMDPGDSAQFGLTGAMSDRVFICNLCAQKLRK